MDTLIFITFGTYAVWLMSFVFALNFEPMNVAKAQPVKVTQTNTDDMQSHTSWSELGDKPIFGDTSDQGAFDIVLTIKDLQYKEEATDDWSHRAFIGGKIRNETNRLVEIMLLQKASPEHSAEDDYMELSQPSNIAYAASRFQKKPDR